MSKWTQEKIEERLLPVLKELGKGYKQIAKSLQEKKIIGLRSNPNYCPIANLVRKTFKSAGVISIDDCIIDIYFGDRYFYVYTPKNIGNFVRKFDEGYVPELETSI